MPNKPSTWEDEEAEQGRRVQCQPGIHTENPTETNQTRGPTVQLAHISRILLYVSLMSESTKSQKHMKFTVLYTSARSHKLKHPKHMSSLS